MNEEGSFVSYAWQVIAPRTTWPALFVIPVGVLIAFGLQRDRRAASADESDG